MKLLPAKIECPHGHPLSAYSERPPDYKKFDDDEYICDVCGKNGWYKYGVYHCTRCFANNGESYDACPACGSDSTKAKHDWQQALGEVVRENQECTDFCVRLTEDLWDLLMGHDKPLRGQVFLISSVEDMSFELQMSREKATPHKLTEFLPRCYRQHFDESNELHDGALLVVGCEWAYARFVWPEDFGCGTKAIEESTLKVDEGLCLAFSVSEDDETLSVIRKGKTKVLADKADPGLNESKVKESIAESLRRFYVPEVLMQIIMDKSSSKFWADFEK